MTKAKSKIPDRRESHMKRTLFYFSLIVILSMFGCVAKDNQVLLPVEDFESGSLEGWKAEESGEGTFNLTQDDVRTGQYSLALKCKNNFWVQKEWNIEPGRFEYLKIIGYIKGTSQAMIGLVSMVNGKSKSYGYSFPLQPKNTDQWQEVSAKIHVPEDADKLKVICTVRGENEAYFDNLRLEEIGWEYGIKMQINPPGIVRVEGAQDAIIQKDADEVEFTMPLPLLTDYQVPLNCHLEIDPPEKLIAYEVKQRVGSNWICKAVCGPVTKDEVVKVRFWSDVFMIKADFSDFPKKAAIPDIESYPQEVKIWLHPSATAQSDHEKIQTEAQRLLKEAGGPDSIAFIRTMLDAFRKIKYDNPPGCDAVTTLEHGGGGICTCYANLGAALCRAVGIPARVIAGYPTNNNPLQTHYIIEAFINGYGWTLVETTIRVLPLSFPYQPYHLAYVSHVYIEDEESAF